MVIYRWLGFILAWVFKGNVLSVCYNLYNHIIAAIFVEVGLKSKRVESVGMCRDVQNMKGTPIYVQMEHLHKDCI